MGAVYALLGLVVGIAIAEALRGRVGDAGEQHGNHAAYGPRRSPAAQAITARQTPQSSGRFAAQDYYDR